MKFLKIGLSIVALAVVLLALAGSLLYFLLDPNQLKPILVAEVKARTGYELSIEGQLGWKWYPWLAVSIPHMQIKQPKQLSVLADMTQVRVAADLNSLLHRQQPILGRVEIGKLTLIDLHAANVSARLRYDNNVLIINSIRAQLYGGELSGSGTGTHFASNPLWQWDVTLRGVQMKPLLFDLDARNKLLVTGLSQVRMVASATGKTQREMLSTLNGKVNFSVSDGTIDTINLNYLIRTADALLNKQPTPAPDHLNQTTFDSFTGQANISNGNADLSNIQLVSDAFQSKGQGSINLLNNQINMQVVTMPQQDVKSQWRVPVKIIGTLEHPDVRLDTDQISKESLKQQIEKVKDKARDLIEKHVKGDVGVYLQKLMSR